MNFWRQGTPHTSGTPRWALFERERIPCTDHPDQTRFVRYLLVQTPWAGLYVHRFDRPDVRMFHDHPWNFVSLILRGGYVEATPSGVSLLRVGSVNCRRAIDPHYIAALRSRPTWTLVLVGRRHRPWGYIDAGTWTRFDRVEAVPTDHEDQPDG